MRHGTGFSALQRAEIAEIIKPGAYGAGLDMVSVLFNEPKLLKYPDSFTTLPISLPVSVLFNEPKLLKFFR